MAKDHGFNKNEQTLIDAKAIAIDTVFTLIIKKYPELASIAIMNLALGEHANTNSVNFSRYLLQSLPPQFLEILRKIG